MLPRQLSPTGKRLLPLYLAVFFQNVVFWFATEKLFMITIGFDNATIGLMIAAYTLVVLLSETPSGILADRWSRRGVLLLAIVSLFLATLIGGLSGDVTTYILAMLFWGLYIALNSGTLDSIIYDTLQEEEGSSKRFNLFSGRQRIIEGFGLIIGSVAGGLIADGIGLRETFFYSIPVLIAAAVFLLKFKEPQLHKADIAEPILKHISYTLKVVFRRRELIPLLISLVSLSIVLNMIYEFTQIWFIALALPVFLFGPAFALVFSSASIGGFAARWLQSNRVTMCALLIMVLAAIILVIPVPVYINIAAQVILASGLVATTIYLTHRLHDHLPSKVRAGSSSAVGTLTGTLMIPTSLLFGAVAVTSVFSASYILLALVCAAALSFAWIGHFLSKTKSSNI